MRRPSAIAPGPPAGERAAAHVQLEAVVLDLGGGDVERRAPDDPKPQRQPVRSVNQVFVLDVASGDLADQSVVQAGDVGARVVHIVGLGLRERAAGDEVPVAQRAQRLPQPLAGGVEALVDQRPHTRRPLGTAASDFARGPPLLQPALVDQRPDRDVVEGRDHQVGPRLGQQLAVTEAGDPDRGHPARRGGADPARRVVDDDADLGCQVEPVRGGQEGHRVGLAAREVLSGQVHVEQVLQRHPLVDDVVVQELLGGEGVDPDLLEERPGVLRRRRRRDPQAGGLERQHEPQGVGEGHEPAPLDEGDEPRLLGLRIALRPTVHIRYPEVLQRGPGPGQPRPSRHHLPVHGRGELLRRPPGADLDVAPLTLHELLEGLAPGQLVRGVDKHAVDVNDHPSEGRALWCHALHRSSPVAGRRHRRHRATLSPAAVNAAGSLRHKHVAVRPIPAGDRVVDRAHGLDVVAPPAAARRSAVRAAASVRPT